MAKLETIKLDDIEYVRKDSAQAEIKGDRAIIVIDRGWVFAGDVVRENGRIKLTRAIHVFRWESIGFDGMVDSPNSNKVTLKPLKNSVDMPESAEIFSIPVSEDWGL